MIPASSELRDVVVVGGGPVGMTAAVLLAARGLKVTIIEKNAGTANDPKAISLDDESLRAYAAAGIAEEVLKVIIPGTGTSYYGADGRHLFHAGTVQPLRFGFPFKNPFAQPDLEKVLAKALLDHPNVELSYSTELIEVSQDDTGITATVNHAGVRRPIAARYLLGADGGRSGVRAALGIGMTGRSHRDVWLVIDCLGDPHLERYGMHHGNPERPHVIVPGLDGRCRYEFYTYPGECDPGEPPPFDLIRELLTPYRRIDESEVERAVAYRFHGVTATAWRVGRTFLLGDAAHMMPPFAGQGLNSGIRDAVNLSWKIAAVVDGQAGPELLASYEAERRPHVEAVIKSSERLGRVVMTTNRRVADFRDATVRRALSTKSGREYFEEMRFRPSPRIESGLIGEVRASPLVGLPIAQPRVFTLDARRLTPLDDVLGGGWSIVGVAVPTQAWALVADYASELGATRVDVPLDDTQSRPGQGITVAIDLDTTLFRELASARGQFLLIRPDRVIALVARPSEFATTTDELLQQIRPRTTVFTGS